MPQEGSQQHRLQGGQFWTPIPRLKGSKLHAETHLQPAKIRRCGLHHCPNRTVAQPEDAAAKRHQPSLNVEPGCIKVVDALHCPHMRSLPVNRGHLVLFSAHGSNAR
jgi:hypothetical protein